MKFKYSGLLDLIALPPPPQGATQLVFVTQPSNSVVAGVDLAQQPVVEIRDVSNAVVTTGAIPLSLVAYTDAACTTTLGGGTLSGATVTSASGLATFSGIDYTKAETIYLKASYTGLTSDCSALVTVSAAALNAASSSIAVTPAAADNVTKSTVTVTFRDAFNNPISGQTPTMRIEMGAGTYTITDPCTASTVLGVSTCKFTTFRPGKQIVRITAPIDLNTGPVTFPCAVSGGTAPDFVSPFMTGVGSNGNPYVISDHHGLEQLRCFNGASFLIAPATTINLAGVSWLPIIKFDLSISTNRTNDVNFASSLDGQGSEIQNLSINSTGFVFDGVASYNSALYDGVAFIGSTYNSPSGIRGIEGITFRDPVVYGSGEAAVVVGDTGFQFNDIHVVGASSSVRGTRIVGGLIARMISRSTLNDTLLMNSSFQGTITYSNGAAGAAGGLIGVAGLQGVDVESNTFEGSIVLDASPSGRDYVGGIIGQITNLSGGVKLTSTPTISLNTVINSTLNLENYGGGIIGGMIYNATFADTPNAYLIENNFVSNTDVICSNGVCGGIIGRLSSAGDLTGRTIALSSNAVVNTDLSGANTLGGIAGQLSLGTIKDSYYVGGALTGFALAVQLGGIAGGITAGTNATLSLDSCYASTSNAISTAGKSFYGGLVGSGMSSLSLGTASYWNTTTSGLSVASTSAATSADANGRTTAELQGGPTGTIFTGWNSATIWTFPGAAYPKLRPPNPN